MLKGAISNPGQLLSGDFFGSVSESQWYDTSDNEALDTSRPASTERPYQTPNTESGSSGFRRGEESFNAIMQVLMNLYKMYGSAGLSHEQYDELRLLIDWFKPRSESQRLANSASSASGSTSKPPKKRVAVKFKSTANTNNQRSFHGVRITGGTAGVNVPRSYHSEARNYGSPWTYASNTPVLQNLFPPSMMNGINVNSGNINTVTHINSGNHYRRAVHPPFKGDLRQHE